MKLPLNGQAGSAINPAALQQMLDSASNAAVKGQAQYLTPPLWADTLSQPLPKLRPFIVDLQCGNGSLLRGAAKRGSELLGCDIDSSVLSAIHSPLSGNFIPADVTRLYALMRAVDFHADLFVLNPPWDLHWQRSELAALAESEVPAVRTAFAGKEPRLGRKQIDSTVATLCLALDRCTTAGEGMVIANEATLQRLIFGDGGRAPAPHHALANHIWAHLVIDGNICLPNGRAELPLRPEIGGAATPPYQGFQTGIIYFAPAHGGGPGHYHARDLKEADSICRELHLKRARLRTGEEVREYTLRFTEETGELWQAIGNELSLQTAATQQLSASRHNLWLQPDGTIGANVSLFDQRSGRVDTQAAVRLHRLQGKRPMQLVVMRNERKELLACCKAESPWTVDPALIAAVEKALVDYDRERAPLYPLSKIMRLGFLDEQDDILCEQSLRSRALHFSSGTRYALRSLTVQVKRNGSKVNNVGGLDAVEWNGQELAFYITDNTGVERIFMDERLRDETVSLNLLTEDGEEGDGLVMDFTLQELVDHFNIPEVPDVAQVNPERYQNNLNLLEEIERLVNA